MAASAGTVTLNLDANSVKLIRELQKSQRQTKRAANRMQRDMQKSFNAISKSANRMGKVVSVAFGFVVVRAMGKAVTASREMERSMAEVQTLMDDTSGIDTMRDAVDDLSKQFGQAPTENAKALYQIISAGAQDAASQIEQLNAVNKLALGGVTDLATAADGLTSVLNAYEDSGISAARASDVMFETMRRGKTTIGELSQSIGNVATIAAQVGVTFEELGASIATVTVSGIDTSSAVNGLRGVLNAALKQSDQTKAAAKDLGIQFDVSRFKAVGLVGVLRDIADSNATESQLSKLVGRVEGLTNILALAKNGGEKFITNLEGIENSAGATERAVEKIATTADQEFRKLSATATVELTKAGDAITKTLLPAIIALREAVSETTGFFDFLGESVVAAIHGIALDDFVRRDEEIAALEKQLVSARDSATAWFRTEGNIFEARAKSLEREIALKKASLQADIDASVLGGQTKPSITLPERRTPSVQFDWQGFREAIALAEKLEADVEKALKSISAELAAFGVSDGDKDLLNLKGATEEQLAQFRMIQDELRILNEIQEAATARAEHRNDLESEYANLINSTRTAAEAHHDQITRIDDLYASGVIPSAEAYVEILERINDKFEDANAKVNELTEFGVQAARTMQTAFADLLFSPFDEGLKSMLSNFAKMLQRMVAEALAAQILGALFSGLAGSSNSFLSGLGSAFSPRADGGPVSAGSTYLVGEKGPELIVPRGSGTVIPNHELGGGGGVTVNIDARETDNPGKLLALVPIIQAQVEQSIMLKSRRGIM